jgi:hypothetical protein
VLIGGPTILQKLYQEGAGRIIGTGFTLADLVIFTKNDKIKSLVDLKASSSPSIWAARNSRSPR